MSHMTEVRTEFRHEGALRAAAVRLGLVELGSGLVKFYGSGRESVSTARDKALEGQAELRFGVQGSRYEIGFARAADGTYRMLGDEECFAGGYGAHDAMRAALGQPLAGGVTAPRLRQAYTAELTKALYQSEGKRVLSEARAADGRSLRIEIEI